MFCVAIFVDEDDIATYTIKTIDDPRTLNKTLYLRPPANILSQKEVVELWEKLIGNELTKSSLSEQEFLNIMKGTLLTCYYFPLRYHFCLVGLSCMLILTKIERNPNVEFWSKYFLKRIVS